MLGFGQRASSLFFFAIVGIFAFLGSFVLLYWNEGQSDLSRLAKEAVVLPSQTVSDDPAHQGQLVSVTGEVTSSSLVGDELFLRDDKFNLIVERTVEMYAWEQQEESEGGGDFEETTSYRYEEVWTTDPESSSEFAYPEGHVNPEMPFEGGEFRAEELMVGAYQLSGDVKLPSTEALPLTHDTVTLGPDAKFSGGYIYIGAGNDAAPEIGDVRVSYKVLRPGFTGTALGALSGEEIVRYVSEDGDKLWRVFKGSHEEAVSTLHGEFVAMTWGLRLLGFLMMWFGLASMLGPLSIVLEVVPLLGRAGRFLIAVATFPVALVLTILTIIISMILHSLIAVIVVGVLVVGAAAYYLKQKYYHQPAGTTK